MTALSPQSLLDTVACYACLGLTQAELIKLALLKKINKN